MGASEIIGQMSSWLVIIWLEPSQLDVLANLHSWAWDGSIRWQDVPWSLDKLSGMADTFGVLSISLQDFAEF